MDQLVSVIMPAYNASSYIKKAIDSILNQTYTNFELLISDDASKDDTLKVVAQFTDTRVRLFKQDVNLGYAHNMNFLLTAAKGDFILIQDADDYAVPERLEVLLSYIEQHPDVDVLGSAYVKFNDEGHEYAREVLTGKEKISEQFEGMTDPLPVLNGSLLFKRKIVEDKVLFRDLRYVSRGQDDDWLFRISERFTVDNVQEVLYYYRSNSTSMTLNPALINYKSIFAGGFVRFLKRKRTLEGIDLLEGSHCKDIESFFNQKKKEITRENPAYLESYIAHRYLAIPDFTKSLLWLFKALLKNPTNTFFWKKIIYVLLASLKKA